MVCIKDENLKNSLYVMVGLPASGKTHIALERIFEPDGGTVYVSRDEIRFEIIGEEDSYFAKESQVYQTFVDRIQAALDSGKSVIADATHLNKASRGKLLRNLRLSTKTRVVAVHVDASLPNCLARNDKRVGRAKVPKDVIISMYRSFSKPKLEEGFDEIIVEDNRFEMRL